MSAEPTHTAATEDLYALGEGTDPLGDQEALARDQASKNFARVGSARPSTLLYTYGPGSIIDLPHFTVMPTGLHDWDRIWARRTGEAPTLHAPRLLETVQLMLGPQVAGLRPFPHQPASRSRSEEGRDLGVPAMIFPQWLRCTGCDRLAPLSQFVGADGSGYTNTRKYRPDQAIIEHVDCPGRPTARGRRPKSGRSKTRRPCVPARYLLACPQGHLDEFPYDWWVHGGGHCTKAAVPVLTMSERGSSRGASAVIRCESCDARRGMNEAQGEAGAAKLPACRGRMPHLDAFAHGGCGASPRLMLVGASNLWFPTTQSIIVMPRLDPAEILKDRAAALRAHLGEQLETFVPQPAMLRAVLGVGDPSETIRRIAELSDEELAAVVMAATAPPEPEAERLAKRAVWSPTDLLRPEWTYLLKDPVEERHEDKDSGLTLSPRPLAGYSLPGIRRVLAVDRLVKVNALLGFTRIDDFDRVDDSRDRLVPLGRTRPTWVPGTQDRGEGIFLQLDEARVAAWEQRVEASSLWAAHVASHRRNFERRYSETAKEMNSDERMYPARYWLVHTLAHLLIRELAMHSGYGAASISERLYAWKGDADHDPAAGMLLVTTASDSDGTLGGLVALSDPAVLEGVLTAALHRARRCSSDPVCASRVPQDPEDFLHGAACHCCVMASETSCERANRFLDRRLVVPLPGELEGKPFADLAFLREHS